MKKEKSSIGILILIAIIMFILFFTYSSLNLKNIDYGYDMQELTKHEKGLREEIDKLRAEKAYLLNLKRVERIVINQLGYQYPEPHQLIKVFEK